MATISGEMKVEGVWSADIWRTHAHPEVSGYLCTVLLFTEAPNLLPTDLDDGLGSPNFMGMPIASVSPSVHMMNNY